MTNRHKHFYEFGPFTLHPEERRLERNGEALQLTPKAFEVLLFLVENGGHVLRKEEFLQKVWAGSYVEEKNLADNISLLRKALGDDPRSPSFIETVPRLGYRFVADMREVREDSDLLLAERTRTHIVVEEDVPAVHLPPAGLEGSAPIALLPAAQRSSRAFAMVVGVVVVLTTLFVAYYLMRDRPAGPNQPAQVRSLAVLPFKPLGSNIGDEDYLGLGMADALITKLSNLRQLSVRPTSAVLKYDGAQRDLAAVGKEQQVDAVLDGSFQRAGERVRVTVQLVRGGERAPLWAATFDEKFTDIFSVQDAIARRIASALALKLSSEESERLTKHHTENPEAYRLYLLGRYFWNKRTPEGFEKALYYYRGAVAADPNFALAHAGLAETYVLLPSWTNASPDDSYREAERAARRALELDPQVAEAYATLGAIKQHRHENSAGVGEDYRRALELNPNYATAHQWYSEWLAGEGRVEEALAEGATALRIDPLSPIITLSYGVQLTWARRTEEAEAQIRRALELEPALYRAHVFLSRIHYDRGQYEQAIRERSLAFARGDEEKAARFEAVFMAAYHAGGREGFLRKEYEVCSGPELSPEHRLGGRVEACARLGDKECTFAALEEAVRADHPIAAQIKVDPNFDFLRSDPRYAELLRRMGLPQ